MEKPEQAEIDKLEARADNWEAMKDENKGPSLDDWDKLRCEAYDRIYECGQQLIQGTNHHDTAAYIQAYAALIDVADRVFSDHEKALKKLNHGK